MTNEENAHNRELLLDMARMFMRGKVICAAVRLGIPDVLGDGKTSLHEIAAATSSNSESLLRLLRALASIGVVAEVAPARFTLTPLGEPLRRNAEQSVWASSIFWADLLCDFWTYLPECVRTGESSGAAAEMEKLGLKSRWSMEADAEAIFHEVFAEPSAGDMAPFLAAYDFSGSRLVADLGGAGGGLIAAILTQNPKAQGILVEQQEAIDHATAKLGAAGLTGRCELVVGDLLEEVPVGADLYILKFVLHGYGDIDAQRILKNCRAAMKMESRLLLIETVLPDRVCSSDKHVEKMMMGDLNMLVATGGRERSATDWKTLLSSARLELLQVASVRGTVSSIIEAKSSASESS